MTSSPQIKNRVAPTAYSTTLKRFLGLRQDSAIPACYRDAFFVAIDFEGHEHPDIFGIYQISVSILDTRDLPYASELGHSLILTKPYRVLKSKKLRRATKETSQKFRRLRKGMSKWFNFGKPEWVTREQIYCSLITIFQDCSSDSLTPLCDASKYLSGLLNGPRNIVLVGHGLGHELRDIEKLGFRPDAQARIITHVDTQNLANEIGGHKRFNKSRSLLRYELSPNQLYDAGMHPKSHGFHNAGKDAFFTLEAMLLLILKEYREPVDAPTGWIKLTKLSIPKLLNSASAKVGKPIVGLHKTLDPDTSEPLTHLSGVKGIEEVTSTFMLAAARWQMARQFGQISISEKTLQLFFPLFIIDRKGKFV